MALRTEVLKKFGRILARILPFALYLHRNHAGFSQTACNRTAASRCFLKRRTGVLGGKNRQALHVGARGPAIGNF
ncbi:MAG: hypothetical protein ACLFWF_13260, partial [Alphaproteobacteria bacterium]